jgi:hypothetical protein
MGELNTVFSKMKIGDPLYYFLTKKLRLNFGRLLFILLSVNIVRNIIIPYFHFRSLGGYYFKDRGDKDIQSLIVSFVVQPIVLYVYLKSVEIIPTIFSTLLENHVIKHTKGKNLPDFVHFVEHNMTSRLSMYVVFIGAFVVLMLFHIYIWPGTDLNNPPYGAYPYGWADQIFIESFHGYILYCFVGWAAWRFLIFAISTIKLWKDYEMDIQVYHQDGAGGLSPISDITRYVGLLVGALTLFAGLSYWSNLDRPGVLRSLVVVLALATFVVGPLIFLIIVWSTHREMVQWRRQHLSLMGQKATSIWCNLHYSNANLDEEKIKQLRAFNEMIEIDKKDIPTWPFRPIAFFRYMFRIVLTSALIPELLTGSITAVLTKYISVLLST